MYDGDVRRSLWPLLREPLYIYIYMYVCIHIYAYICQAEMFDAAKAAFDRCGGSRAKNLYEQAQI